MKIDSFLLEFKNTNEKGTPKIRWPTYTGNPYYVTGNAIFHSKEVCDQLTEKQKQNLKVSHGIFVNMYPEYTNAYRNSKGQIPGHKIPNIKTYHDLFILRQPILPFDTTGGLASFPDYYPTKISGDPVMMQKRALLHFYAIGVNNPEVFDSIQLGGKRNMGCGETRIVGHKTVEFDDLDFTRLLEKENPWCELITPLCLSSEFTNTKAYKQLPSFMGGNGRPYRTRTEYIKQAENKYNLQLIDHGQAFPYIGGKFKDDKETLYTAKSGLMGIYNHGKYGYGEIMLR